MEKVWLLTRNHCASDGCGRGSAASPPNTPKRVNTTKVQRMFHMPIRRVLYKPADGARKHCQRRDARGIITDFAKSVMILRDDR
jgi:hypothetical protein